ncbi:MAG: HAMP domain-containing sensor histidine kinase [Eubacteriales bacterium]|nr:HAMP domain-containing sensor histidine kinase [Eubacteriales bacterium]
MSKKKREREARKADRERMARERAAVREGAQGKGINRLSSYIHGWASTALSNLRFSLTLRIALHYCGQLLSTTVLVWLAFTVVFAAAQAPSVDAAFDALAAQSPAQENQYAAEQLVGLPLTDAYVQPEPVGDDMKAFFERVGCAWSSLMDSHWQQVAWSRGTVRGETVAVFSLAYVSYVYSLLFWTLVCCELYRVAFFLRRRYRLDHTVLRPLKEMTDTAATLGASNLSNRINIAGTKNELKDLALVINGMLDRIERSYNSQKQFVSNASHELRQPIAVIQGYASMLERWGKTDKAVLDEGISAISQETASMKELVERLLFLARHDKKTLMLEMEVFDPTEVMSAVHRDAQLLSAAHTFRLEPVEHCMIEGDKSMIKQLMRILVDNAIKYTPPGGSVTLGVRRSAGQCVLSVTDTGAGMTAEELPRIFDRFYRSDKARKAQSSGHGLGLSIARIIVVAHGGKIKVRSKEGVGTTFSVLLPLANPK